MKNWLARAYRALQTFLFVFAYLFYFYVLIHFGFVACDRQHDIDDKQQHEFSEIN
jgi:hypothetical protein